jgi:Homoserine dehydrogenase
MVQIAVLGHGVVGSGVVEVLDKNKQNIQRKAGVEIDLKYILDIRDFPDSPHKDKFIKDFNVILNDPDIKVVVEVIGGIVPAYDFVKASLLAGKNVVTSNKELVAQKGAELLKLAGENHVNFLFEASVGGGIPIIRPLHQCLAANEIDEIAGILNGTTNFILTKMIKEGMTLQDALAQAQRLGYAEANPAADIEGIDTCRKICILASLAFGSHVYPDCVQTSGITCITQQDMQYAQDAECVIKLIGQARSTGEGKVYALVGPAFIRQSSQLAGIDDEFNGILVRGDATGDVVFYGKGAGKLPTASAVIGDVIECVRAEGTIASQSWEDSDGSNVLDYKTEPVVMYIRCEGDCAQVELLFGSVQTLSRKKQPPSEVAFLTPKMPEGEILAKLEQLAESGAQVLNTIRLLEY